MLELHQILHEALQRKASDIIITAGAPIAFRISDEVAFIKMSPLSVEEAQKQVYQMLSNDQIARYERDLELDFSITYQGSYRFRGNVFKQRGAVGAALRLVPTKIPTMEDLNLPPIAGDIALREHGLLLVTGPTGHGKSTTQAAMIDHINSKRRCHVITVEDPIEFIHQNRMSVVEQREVGEDTKSFADALKHVLRQNPDVVLVGEMRDLESIGSALTAAETGHLVFSTLHTNDAVQAISRIIDVFPPHQQGQIRMQLSMTLQAVFSQRLVPRADGSGLILATEVLVNNNAVSNLIREEKVHQLYTVMETHARDGMTTMDQALKELYLKNLIRFDDARARMRNPQLL